MASHQTNRHVNPFLLPLILGAVALIVVLVGFTQGVLQLAALGDAPAWFWAFLVSVLGATVLVWWLALRAKTGI